MDLSRSIEDYLKSIFVLGDTRETVQTSELAEALRVAPASVSGMVRRLADLELLEHRPYRGFALTQSGRRAALRIIRRHRILETYLVTVLGWDWDSVHEEAEHLEHTASERLVAGMAEALGNPRFDPHGAPIPTVDGEIEEQDLVPMSEVGVGSRGEFRLVSDEDPGRLRYIASLGFRVGTRFGVLDALPFNGPFTVLREDGGAEPQVIGFELAKALQCLKTSEEAV